MAICYLFAYLFWHFYRSIAATDVLWNPITAPILPPMYQNENDNDNG